MRWLLATTIPCVDGDGKAPTNAITFTAAPDSPAKEALAFLASWATSSEKKAAAPDEVSEGHAV